MGKFRLSDCKLEELISRYKEFETVLSQAIAEDTDLVFIRLADSQLVETKKAILQYNATTPDEMRLQFDFVLKLACAAEFAAEPELQVLSALFERALVQGGLSTDLSSVSSKNEAHSR